MGDFYTLRRQPYINRSEGLGYAVAEAVIKDDVARFVVGIHKHWRDRETNEKKTSTTYIRCRAAGPGLCELAAAIRKGDALHFSGELEKHLAPGLRRAQTQFQVYLSALEVLDRRKLPDVDEPYVEPGEDDAYDY